MKAQITRKKINLRKLFFVNYIRAGARFSLYLSYFVTIKNSKDIFGN